MSALWLVAMLASGAPDDRSGHPPPANAAGMLAHERTLTAPPSCRSGGGEIVVCADRARDRYRASSSEDAPAAAPATSAERRSAGLHALDVCRAAGNQHCATAAIPLITVPLGAGPSAVTLLGH